MTMMGQCFGALCITVTRSGTGKDVQGNVCRLKASTFFSLAEKISCIETSQLMLRISNAIWLVMEPY